MKCTCSNCGSLIGAEFKCWNCGHTRQEVVVTSILSNTLSPNDSLNEHILLELKNVNKTMKAILKLLKK